MFVIQKTNGKNRARQLSRCTEVTGRDLTVLNSDGSKMFKKIDKKTYDLKFS